MGWSREFWFASLGLPAQPPPREEAKKVKTAIGAARAKAARHPTSSNGRSKARAASKR